MSVVNVGNRNSESFTVSVFHSGSSDIDMMLASDLLPGDSQDWLVGVSSLTAPLDSTRYLDETHGELAMLCRLIDGQPFDAPHYLLAGDPAPVDGYPSEQTEMGTQINEALDPLLATWTQDNIGRLRHDRTPALEFGDLLEQINAWASKINSQIRYKGLNKADNATFGGPLGLQTGGSHNTYFNQAWEPEALAANAVNDRKKRFRHLRVRVGPSGVLSFIGSSLFWSNFFIRISPYFQAITGFSEFVSVDPTPGAYVVRPRPTRVQNGNEVMDSQNQWQIANDDWMESITVTSNRSLWGSADTRLSISLATSLPVQRSLTINDGREVRDFTLGNFALSNEVSVQSEVQDQFMTDFSISSQSRAGHVELKASGPPDYWVSLSSGVNIRQLRLSLMIRERVWSETDKKWTVVHRKLPINDWQTWSAVLIFAKKIH